MLDLKVLRQEPERVKKAIVDKGEHADVDALLALDEKRRSILVEVEQHKKRRNEGSKEIGKKIAAGEDAESLKAEIRALGEKIKALDEQIKDVENTLNTALLTIPNLPYPEAPTGFTEEDNRFVRGRGEKPQFDFQPKPHWEIVEALDIVDFGKVSTITGSNFVAFKGPGARLERALINFMLDLHIEKHGYKEVSLPFIVNRDAMIGTGQIPKLEDDMYRIDKDDLFLIPTAEVPVTNLHRNEMLMASDLPIRYVAYTPCFRREAGSYGKETRGLTRIHQFDKVEMVKFVLPETSYDELETLVNDAEEVLELLGLHYRVMELCTGDMSFAAAKVYDIEVWAPGMDTFLEVSSGSNFTDFQARRADIRFRREEGAKPEFLHTLNCSGVALPRTVIALLETYQQPDGSVVVPEILRNYMKCEKIQ